MTHLCTIKPSITRHVPADATVRAKLVELGFLPVGGQPDAYAEVVATEVAKWRQVIRDSNIPAPN